MVAKIFSRENKCSKVDLFNCFWKNGEFRDRPVVEAHKVIGLNAPKYLMREGYVTRIEIKNVEYFHPTVAGDAWLRKGITRHIDLHPEDRALLIAFPAWLNNPYLPKIKKTKTVASPVTIKATEATVATNTPATVKRIVRTR